MGSVVVICREDLETLRDGLLYTTTELAPFFTAGIDAGFDRWTATSIPEAAWL